jgi:hypothetical protein
MAEHQCTLNYSFTTVVISPGKRYLTEIKTNNKNVAINLFINVQRSLFIIKESSFSLYVLVKRQLSILVYGNASMNCFSLKKTNNFAD